MTLQLTGQNESGGLYQEFYGSLLQQMPILIARGLDPISVAGAIGRRESAPADVIDEWRRNYIFTGDGAAYDGRNNAKIILNAALLREINSNTQLINGARILSNDQWEELHGDAVLYLSADKVGQAHNNGFVKRKGVWQPENTVVGDVWEHLSQGKDLKDYAEMVSKASGSNYVMWLWFDRNHYTSPVMRSLVLDRIDLNSGVYGNNDLNDDVGRLVGVAPEAHIAREKALEERV
ncbi:MAG: hypothetical protein Q8R53_06320 [Nanoarchaeota archaeon]|nr:hypothetical protein [Nanoarchaeota archaeon]